MKTKIEIEIEYGSDYQIKLIGAIMKSFLDNIKIFTETRHKKNKVKIKYK